MSQKENEILEIRFTTTASDMASFLTSLQFLADQYDEISNEKGITNEPGNDILKNNALFQYLLEIYKKTDRWKENEILVDKLLKNSLESKIVHLSKYRK